ncbi:MAG: riboflavin kinase [Rickettsiales bacterium]|nr:riboflavin kinase [Rickettsiales bacterium]
MFFYTKPTCKNNDRIVDKPIDVVYNRFYMQMRLLRTKIEQNDSEKKSISITGVVVKGKGGDTILHYPTINLNITTNNDDKNSNIIVENGSYISNVAVNKNYYNAVSFINENVIKTHIINFNEDVIGKKVKIRLIQFLRPVEEFETTKDLVEAMASDVFLAKDYFYLKK